MPFFSYIFAERLELGNDVDIRPFVYVNVTDCVIGCNSIVSYGVQIAGSKGFSTKDNCFIGPHCIIHCEENVSLGFYSGLGAHCLIYSHGSFLPVTRGYPAKFAEIVIEDYVWTAMGVSFLPGAHVESNCILNAGIVINSRIHSGTILQYDAKHIQQLDLNKVIGYAKRNASHYHARIIQSFLASRNIKDAARYHFESHPESNELSLHLPGKETPLKYDLEHYYCDYSSDAMHKAFLAFLRLRFGISLRTKY